MVMREKFVKIIFSILIILIVILSINYFIKYDNTTWEEPEIFPMDSLPDIVISYFNKTSSFHYSNTELEYEPQVTFQTWYAQLCDINEKILIENYGEFTLYNSELERLIIRDFGLTGKIISNNGYLYFSSGGYFYILNEDLETIGKVEINLSWVSWNFKEIHDIIIDENHAYCLDNLYLPIYIISINISDPFNPMMEYAIEVGGANMHLSTHWIDKENDRWSIITDQGISTGTFQTILNFFISNGTYIESRDTYIEAYWNDYKKIGWKIKAATPFSPSWLIVEEDGKYFLRTVQYKNGRDTFKNIFYLGIEEVDWYQEQIIKQYDDLLFLGIGDQLLVVNIQDEPYLALSQTIEYPIADIILF